MYVYEYLIHTGATKASQLFLQEVSTLAFKIEKSCMCMVSHCV